MEKFPFTDAGVQALQDHLYQCTDEHLSAEEKLILLNFSKWVAKNFTLSTEQLLFIEEQDKKIIDFLATQTAIAIVNRLPVILLKPASKPDHELTDSKLIRPASNFSVSSDSPNQITGALIIEITYCLKAHFILESSYPSTGSG